MPKFKFIIGRAYDVLATGYCEDDEKKNLAKLIKESKIHYPTPEEIAAKKELEMRQYKIDQEKRLAKLFSSPRPSTKKKATKKKKVEPLETKDGLVPVFTVNQEKPLDKTETL